MKRWFCAALCLVLCFLPCTVAAAAETADPVIYVTGFGSATLTKDAGTAAQTDVYPPAAAAQREVLSDLVPDYISFRLTDNTDAYADALAETMQTLLLPLRCNPDGTSAEAITVKNKNVVSASQPTGKRNYFYYDWRLDVYDTAQTLHDYIEDILAVSKKTRVALVCSSMGACVGAAYLARYGSEKLSALVFSSGAAMGVGVVGDLLCGTLHLQQQSLYDYLLSLGLANSIVVPDALQPALTRFGGPERVLWDAADAICQNGDKFYRALVLDLLAGMPGIWCLLPADRLEQALTSCGIDRGGALYQRIRRYQFDVKGQLVDAITAAQQNGVKLAVLAGYGLEAAPMVGGRTAQSDGLVETTSASFGAVCADLNTTFASDYRQKQNPQQYRISPDCCVDASACAFPDNTWFVRGASHSAIDDAFLLWVITTKGGVRVDVNDSYPQFVSLEDELYAPQTYTADNLLETTKADIITTVRVAVLSVRFLQTLTRRMARS